MKLDMQWKNNELITENKLTVLVHVSIQTFLKTTTRTPISPGFVNYAVSISSFVVQIQRNSKGSISFSCMKFSWIALQHACLCSYIKIERVCTHQRKCKKCYVGWTFWKNMNNHRSKRRHNVSRMICLRIPCKKRGQEAFVLCMARIMRMTFKY